MHYPWVADANRVFTGVLIGQFLIALLIAFYTDTWGIAFLIGLPILIVPLALIQTNPFSQATQHSVGIAVQLMTALHLQQAMGMTELHFEIFVVLAFLSFYRNWQVILSSVLVVAVHHILFYITQSQGMETYIYESNRIYFYILVIHAAFALIEGGVLMYIAKMSHNEAVAALSLSNTVDNMLSDKGQINLNQNIDTDNEQLVQFGRLLTSFRQLIERAKSISVEVHGKSTSVDELSAGVYQATKTSSDQIDSIATAIEQMTVTNESVAQQAGEANGNSTAAQNSTHEAKQIIAESTSDISQLKTEIAATADTISELAEKCNRIEEVMSAIKSISEQTNLLALNAAIESARAGEHGRGFAVVADEVRGLASKTRENAEEISEVTSSLISDASLSVNQMHNCIQRVENAETSSLGARDVMDAVVSGISSVANNISTVAIAVSEQSTVSASISESTQELHVAADEQKRDVEIVKTEVEELKHQIDLLTGELSRFDV